MKTKVLLVSLLFFVHTQSSRELKKTNGVQELTKLPETSKINKSISRLKTALPITALQYLILDYLSWEHEQALLDHKSSRQYPISRVAFSSNDQCMASCSENFIKIWQQDDNNKWICVQTLERNRYTICSLIFSEDSKYLIACGCDNFIRIWQQDNNKQWQCMQTLEGDETLLTAIAFSRNNKFLASGTGNTQKPTIKIWQQDPNDNKWTYLTLDTYNANMGGQINDIIFSPDSNYLIFSGSWDNTIKIWQEIDNKWISIETLTDHADRVTSIAFSSEGKYLASGSFDKTIKIWQLDVNNKWTCIQTLTDHANRVNSITFSSDGKYLISGAEDNAIKIWQLDANNKWLCIRTLTGHAKGITTVAFSRNNKYLASGCWNQIINIWHNQKSEILDHATQKEK
jgi:WD40 repeat protein